MSEEIKQEQPTVSQTPPEVKNNETVAEKKEDQNEINWKAYREKTKKEREEAKRAIEERDRMLAQKQAEAEALKAAMEAAFAKSAPTPQAYQQYYGLETEETEEQKIEKKVNAILEERERKAHQEYMEREKREYPNRLSQMYPDFSQTINEENLDYLQYHYPEVAGPLSRLPDGIDKWSDIYRAVKKFVPNSLNHRQDSLKSDVNSMKPKSMSSVGATQNTDSLIPTRLTDERRAANWARMQAALKGIG